MSHYVTADGKDIVKIIEDIQRVVVGLDVTNVSIACIVISAIAQKPTATMAEIQETVRTVSEVMATALWASGTVN